MSKLSSLILSRQLENLRYGGTLRLEELLDLPSQTIEEFKSFMGSGSALSYKIQAKRELSWTYERRLANQIRHNLSK